MLKFIIRRLLFMLFIMLGISILLFTIMYKLPGDPARAAAGIRAKPAQVESVRRQLGLDKPLHIQYLTYINNIFRGKLGISVLTRKPVASELKVYVPASFELVLGAMLWVGIFGVPLGVFSALKPGKLVDIISRFITALGMGMPVFWIGLIAQMFFYGKLDILPFGGRLSMGLIPPPNITGLYTLDAIFMKDFILFKDAFVHLLLPSFILALPELAFISRLTQNSMMEVLQMDYITVARAKGLSEKRVVWIHALKNALSAPMTMFSMQIGILLGGTILVESIFSWGGLGYLIFQGILIRDFPVIMGSTLVITFVFMVSNLFADILYCYLDPRIVY